jgi:hypothetical protein
MLNFVFQNSLNIMQSSNYVASSHLWKTFLLYSLSKSAMTWWSTGWIKDVVLAGRNFTLIKENSAVKLDTSHGQAVSERAFNSILFLVR